MVKKIGILFLLLLLGGNLFPASLKVSPAGFIIHDITPGKTYNLYEKTKLKLSIYNDDDITHTYTLSVRKPSEVGRWEKGYLEIPDPSWCWFEKKEITIGPRKVGYGNLFIKIPPKEEYYNQHWVATLGIMGKPERSMGIGLGIYIRVQIETESKADIEVKPDGVIAFKPSIVRFENIHSSNTQKRRVMVYNNDEETHTYTITSLLHRKETNVKTYLTRSYQVIPNPGWIVLDKDRLKIKPNGSSVLSLELNVPDEQEYHGKRWEEILLFEPDRGAPGFIRVQIETEKVDIE